MSTEPLAFFILFEEALNIYPPKGGHATTKFDNNNNYYLASVI
jgi:hypothetical protein